MTIRVGLYVGSDWVACVAIARHGIVWHAGTVRVIDGSLEAQLATLLQGIPIKRFTRTSVFVALGQSVASMKCLRGLPSLESPSVVRQLMEETPSRFFLVQEESLVVAEPQRRADGWWVAVANATTVAAVDAACARRGLRQGEMRPVAILLHHALADARAGAPIYWCDGDVGVAVTYGEHGITSLRREPTLGRTPPAPATGLDAPLETLGADAWRFAGAYAAARAGRSAPLLLRRREDGNRTPRRIALRVGSIAALAVGAALMLAAPGLVAARTRIRSDRLFSALRASASSVAKDRIALEQQQAALRQMRAFVDTRRLITPLLSALSLQLPESTAIVALRLDTLGGTLVALSPLGEALVPAVGTTPGVDGLQLGAPITRETVGSLELQRTVLRFRFKPRAYRR